jgi:hypothetical protein
LLFVSSHGPIKSSIIGDVPVFNIHVLKEYKEAALKLNAKYTSYNMAINCYVHIPPSLPGAETLDVVQRGKCPDRGRLDS